MKILMSKLYTDSRTTIPKEVRDFLGVKDGDGLLYRFEDDLIELRNLVSEMGEVVLLLPNKKKSKKDRFKTF